MPPIGLHTVNAFIPFRLPAFAGRVHNELVMALKKEGLSDADLQTIWQGNIGQDRGEGLNHPEYHFDGMSTFSELSAGFAYIGSQRALICDRRLNREQKLLAFGRITHAVQDFYAHSNYVELYAAFRKQPLEEINPASIPLLETALRDQRYAAFACVLIKHLRTGSWALDPNDPKNKGPHSHTAMNKDEAGRPGHDHARNLAERQTVLEYRRVACAL